MVEDDTWNTVDVSNTESEVEYEIEEEVEEPKEEEVIQEEDAPKEEAASELEGIETQGAQKRIRQLVKQRKDRDNKITALIRHNEELVQRLSSKDIEVKEINKLTLDTSEKQLTDKIELARAFYLEAFEEGDKNKVLKAQEMLNDAQADLKTVTTAKLNFQEEVEASPPPVRQAVQPRDVPSPDAGAEDWASKNEWFGQDKIMTAAALAIDAELKEEGYSPNDEEFYQEIDNRIKTAFPHKFGEVQERVQETEVPVTSATSKPAQVVSGGSRSSPHSRNKIKLSQEDLRLAHKWNIPLETYAAEKLKIDQSGGEYTDVYNK